MTTVDAGGALIADSLTVSAGGHHILTGVSMLAEPGRVLAVTGASGAGKTSLLWTLTGLVRPESGTITYAGEPVGDRDSAVAHGIVLIPQDNGVAPSLTAYENVLIPLIGTGCGSEEAAERAVDALERVGLAGQVEQLVEELSGGQQQRVAIARGLAQKGSVLLADEITSELDAANRERVLELLHAEAWRGAAVVFATHDLEAAGACDARLHLVDGAAEYIGR
ncbi:ABC transporter ATP-binding protein [Actinorhabdospora filicis]|uniref:ABC transporter ATP-binding protein n=1 Tax=Actinorhabdospora filicis TaxID=1785913 RepID=A0A9W6SRT3_9ACTN|nr:ATP-binding cassette domain-containing protein [Actinorhabdospora filicis]GLZ81745.1 ABC transporter ATP-binding protein [Actinorhabdospora filicis]